MSDVESRLHRLEDELSDLRGKVAELAVVLVEAQQALRSYALLAGAMTRQAPMDRSVYEAYDSSVQQAEAVLTQSVQLAESLVSTDGR
jgi:hypothetical protein